MSRRWWLAPLLATCALVTCASSPPPASTSRLPPCPKPTGSVYRPGEAQAQAATPPPPAPSASEVVAAAKAPVPRATFARQSYRAAPRPAPSGAVVTCGDRKTPCPLQRWMREKMAPALAKNDGAALAAALESVAKISPVASWEWKAISEKAALAAKAGDVTEARKSCQGCHNAFKLGYREKFRTRAAPP